MPLASRTKCYKGIKKYIKDTAKLKEIRENLQIVINDSKGDVSQFADHDDLSSSFLFSETRQGFDYWHSIRCYSDEFKVLT